jgi:hypothetical protein
MSKGTINDGGPAFPVDISCYDGDRRKLYGLSLRDYFAAATLQVLVTCHSIDADTREEFAEEAYKLADAMLAERAKRNGGAS